MNAKTEITKVLKDLQESAREFAALGLNMGTKALEWSGAHLKTLEENLKRTADKLKKEEPAVAAEAAAEEKPAEDKAADEKPAADADADKPAEPQA